MHLKQVGLMFNWPKQRAWGWYATLIRTPWFCVKLLRFKPHGALSMQLHNLRTEIWFFIKGDGTILHYAHREKRTKKMVLGMFLACYNPCDYNYVWRIRPKEAHQFIAYEKPVYAIELQYGRKVTETDIERKDD